MIDYVTTGLSLCFAKTQISIQENKYLYRTSLFLQHLNTQQLCIKNYLVHSIFCNFSFSFLAPCVLILPFLVFCHISGDFFLSIFISFISLPLHFKIPSGCLRDYRMPSYFTLSQYIQLLNVKYKIVVRLQFYITLLYVIISQYFTFTYSSSPRHTV